MRARDSESQGKELISTCKTAETQIARSELIGLSHIWLVINKALDIGNLQRCPQAWSSAHRNRRLRSATSLSRWPAATSAACAPHISQGANIIILIL